MNESDSERLAFFLESNGLLPSPSSKEADLVLINMCSVRQTAVDRVFGKIEKLKDKKICLTGCFLKKDKEKLEERVDLIFSIQEPEKLYKIIEKKKVDISPRYSNFIPIMTGCNNFCSYCVVPYTRGRETSRKPKEIEKEAKSVIKRGAKIIWLLGQNVNSYQYNFPELLKRIRNLKGNFWLQFTSSHPKDLSLELIKAMKECKIKYLNLPVQSGNNQILKKMNRPYKIEQYKKIVKSIRKEIPDISLSTDVIVGFPGETEKQFESTKKLFQEIEYDMAYINKYSERKGTKASLLKDNVTIQEKKKREKELEMILKKTALKNNKRFIGKTIEVLPFEKDLATTKYNKKVKGNFEKKNKFKKIKITKALSWGLKA